MEEVFQRFWDHLVNRPSGPLALRFVLQPLMAALLALRAGARDHRKGARPFLFATIKEPTNRRTLLADAWKDIGKVFIIAFVLDTFYQVLVFKFFYPLESAALATFLAILPYIALRSLFNRALRLHDRRLS